MLPHIIEAILNHVSGYRAGVAGIYNRAKYEGEMRDALERWGGACGGYCRIKFRHHRGPLSAHWRPDRGNVLARRVKVPDR